MSGINKVILIGNLGRDPELRYTNEGKAVCNLNVATTFKGKHEEKTEWHRVVVWEQQAEFCNQYLSKGRQVYIEGRLETRSYDDKDGNKRYSTDVVAQTVQFLGTQEQRGGSFKTGKTRKPEPRKPDTTEGDNYVPDDDPSSNIPF